MDREAQWLEEQHALKAAAEAVDSGATDWEAQEGEGGREAQHGEADEEAQEGEAEGEAHEGEEAHHDGQTSETAAEEDAAEGMAEDAASGSEEVLDGDTQVSDEEGEAQADGEGEDGAAGSDDAAEGQGEAGAQEEEEEPEEEDEGLTDIDSPWAEVGALAAGCSAPTAVRPAAILGTVCAAGSPSPALPVCCRRLWRWTRRCWPSRSA